MIKKLFIVVFLTITSLTATAQDITFEDLTKINWNEYPFSAGELLTEKGYLYNDKALLQSALTPNEGPRDSFYQLIYTKLSEVDEMAAYLVVDEIAKGNLPLQMPVIKLVYMNKNKDKFIKLSNEIKEACGDPELEFYFGPNSLAFVIEKQLMEGTPIYSVLAYRMSKKDFDNMQNQLQEAFKKFSEE
ncbi:hypothetical protein [Persicobacter diffluens]|uniref:Uncharacterized protein n=1 Tax=Persicobacter diffluens TaxID=981 RepID=A0AAN4W5E9_9BACT|nr:hypothetical protein PEDI_55050 [Persicobacter diffluens]